MKELFKKTATSIILSSIVAFIIGLIMVVAPGLSLQTIGIVAGIYIIIHGIVLIALAFSAHMVYVPFYGVISGLLSIIIGIVLLAMPGILSTDYLLERQYYQYCNYYQKRVLKVGAIATAWDS